MSNNEWVQEGTPRDADEWSAAQDDYGVPVEPWDDYSSEQGVPTPPVPAVPVERDVEPAPVVEEQAPEVEPVAEPVQEAPEADQWAQPVSDPVAVEGEAPEVAPGEPEPVVEVEPEPVAEVRPVADAEPVADVEPDQPVAPVAAEWAEPVSGPVAVEEEAAEVAPVEPEPVVEVEPVADVEPDQPVAPVAAEWAEPVSEPVAVEEEAPEVAPAEPETTDPFARPEAADREGDESLTETRQRPLEVPIPEDATDEAVLAAGVAAAAAATQPSPTMEGLYRADAEQTQVIDTESTLLAEAAEEERLAEQLRMEREARDQRLGLVATSDANAVRDPNPPRRPGVGGFGSFGLLLLRLVVAGILGVASMQILTTLDVTADYLGQTLIPYPREVAWGLGIGLAAMAVLLVLGLGVRAVGLLLALIAICSLIFLRWGPFPIFMAGEEGFRGDKDLLLAVVGILLFSLGGGKVGIDGAISKARWNAKMARQH